MTTKSKSTSDNAFDNFNLGENLKNNSTTIVTTLVSAAVLVGTVRTVRKMNSVRLRAKRNRAILKAARSK